MALPAAGKGEPASANAPVTSKTHCRLPSCQSIQQPEPPGQALAQKCSTDGGMPVSYQVSGFPFRWAAMESAAIETVPPLPDAG